MRSICALAERVFRAHTARIERAWSAHALYTRVDGAPRCAMEGEGGRGLEGAWAGPWRDVGDKRPRAGIGGAEGQDIHEYVGDDPPWSPVPKLMNDEMSK